MTEATRTPAAFAAKWKDVETQQNRSRSADDVATRAQINAIMDRLVVP